MNQDQHTRNAIVALAVAGVLCVPALAAPGGLTDIGFLPGNNRSAGNGINNLGQVTGSYGTDTFGHGLLWSPGNWRQDLGTLGGSSSSGYAITDSGQITGSSYNAAAQYHAFRWSELAGMQDLGDLGGNHTSQGASINASGQVVGYSSSNSGYPRAFRWTATGGMQDLGTLRGFGNSFANGINDAGQITGLADTVSGKTHAFRWEEATGMQDLGTLPGGTYSTGRAINSAGNVAGYADNAAGQTHAMRWTPGLGMEDLGTVGGTNSGAYGINSAGVVVGKSFLAGDTADRAALWKLDGTPVNLDAWLDSVNPSLGQYWRLDIANGINDQGLVVGTGRYDDGLYGLIDGQRGFILDVSSLVPEPGVIGILASGALSMLSRRRRTTKAG